MHVVLIEPQIAPNTGNLIRLCANSGAHLHLVEPLGFSLDDRLLKRGGLDYHEMAHVTVHPNLHAASAALPGRWFGLSSSAARRYTDVVYRENDVLVFGREQSGMTEAEVARFGPHHLVRIPMRPNNRSLNLANAVGVVVYEAWRQQGFDGAANSSGPIAETPSASAFDD